MKIVIIFIDIKRNFIYNNDNKHYDMEKNT